MAIDRLPPDENQAEAPPPRSSRRELDELAGKQALTLCEAEALGYGSTRHLSRLIAAGRLSRCVLYVASTGRRSIRLHQPTLVEELRTPPS